jgi:hypothetical protein
MRGASTHASYDVTRGARRLSLICQPTYCPAAVFHDP